MSGRRAREVRAYKAEMRSCEVFRVPLSKNQARRFSKRARREWNNTQRRFRARPITDLLAMHTLIAESPNA